MNTDPGTTHQQTDEEAEEESAYIESLDTPDPDDK